MSDSPCPECRVSPCYCDTIVEPTDGGTAQYVRNLRLEDQSHPEPCDHWSPHPKDGFCVACGWAQVVHDIGSPSEHFYNSRRHYMGGVLRESTHPEDCVCDEPRPPCPVHGAGTEREISGLSQEELWCKGYTAATWSPWSAKPEDDRCVNCGRHKAIHRPSYEQLDAACRTLTDENERLREALERIAKEPAPGSTISCRNIAKAALSGSQSQGRTPKETP